MINNETIGVGIVTYNRPDNFDRLFQSLLPCRDIIDRLVIVQDGSKNDDGGVSYIGGCLDQWGGKGYQSMTIKYGRNQGVAKCKNDCFDYLLNGSVHCLWKGSDPCDHMFLIEDDMILKDPKIFEKYIEASKVSGIQHMMFGYHGPANKNGISKGLPCPRLVINYSDDVAVALNRHCVGAFCYYSRAALEQCQMIDEKFKNAFDHVSHSYEIALKGYSTPYWWWADLANSMDYIEEQMCSEESSTIKTPERMTEWRNNIEESMNYFKEKFGVMPFGPHGVPDIPESEVLTFLKSKR